jgi:tetratricopeptide (TPR) repeat protein
VTPDSTENSRAELQAELTRLSEKLLTTDDSDIRAALERRMEELRAALQSQAPVEPRVQLLSSDEVARLKRELAQSSRQLYAEEDPAKRLEIQSSIKDLQQRLGLDIQKLAGREMSEAALPNPSPAAGAKPAKSRTDLADLQALVAEKSALIRKEDSIVDLDLAEDAGPPTTDQAEAAERLIQLARVEKMRGNKQQVRELLEKAAQAAPTSPSVLELLGDDFAERKQIGKALAYYRRASKHDPTNVSLERKIAMAALGIDESGSLDRQMQAELGGRLDDSATPMASKNAALLISIFLPGLGHIVLGQLTKGWITLGIWCISLAWAITMGGDIAKLGSMVVGGRSQPNMIVLIPIFVMAITYFVTLADFRGAKAAARKPVVRPRPPVDLPFE